MRWFFRKKNRTISFISFIHCILLCIFVISIGFASYSKNLGLEDVEAIVRIQKDMRVTGVYASDSVNGGVSNWEEYNVASISTHVVLPNSDSSVTYMVQVTNFANIETALASISGLPSNLEYSSTYSLNSLICDDTDSSNCSLGAQKTIPITISYKENGYDSSNTEYEFSLEFYFKQSFHIYYSQIDDTNLPHYVLMGETIDIQLNAPYPDTMKVMGSCNYQYDAVTGIVHIESIYSDLIVKLLTTAYFVSYDGTSQLFNTFSNSSITSFSRDSTSSFQEVLSKGGVIISTSDSDSNYPSDEPIYGWVENNQLFWWSEADRIYFHPDTTGAFRNCGAIVTVNLTGANTSKVKNFSHWFDKDRVLSRIEGSIDTSGLYYDTSVTFNFANDTDENASSETGLAFMFNDCNALTYVDLSRIDTHNAMDMKRMFGGCKAITSLDIFHFDTSRVKSMYWMFRATEKLKTINLSSFDTSNVQNMFGMFLQSKVNTIILGSNFVTNNVKKFNRMFYVGNSLKTIYVKNDFTVMSGASSNDMFKTDTNLVGAAGTAYATPFDASNITVSYAKIASASQSGYFTFNTNGDLYTISYDLNGGIADNPTYYYDNTDTFILENPYKLGSHFLGWTGSNGSVPQKNVTILQGSTGNLHYVANFQQNPSDNFPTVFRIIGQCSFNGPNNNITGSGCVNALTNQDYTDRKYIDTGVNLYSSENYLKDFEITFDVDEFIFSNQPSGNTQQTVMNSKLEKSNLGYPGVIFRRNGSKYEVKSANNLFSSSTSFTSVRFVRTDGLILYSVNGGKLSVLDRNANYNAPFDLPVWFGASANGSGNPMRHAIVKLSNITIRLGDYSD